MSVLHFYFSMLLLLAPLTVVVGVGTFWGKKGYPFDGQFVTTLVTNASTPALVFHTLATTQLGGGELVRIIIGTVLSLALCTASCAVLLKWRGVPVRELLQTTAFPNAGNLGLPISYLAFGDAGLSLAIVFFAATSFVQHTAGVRMLPNAVGMAAPWKSPVLFAALAAVACRLIDFTPPAWVMDSAKMLGSIAVPLMLLSLGHALALIPSSGLRVGSIVATLRLLCGPVCGYLGGLLAGLSPEMAAILALQMGMPCAVVSYMYARRYTDMGDAAAGAVLTSTVAFIVLSPVLLWILGSPAAR